MNKNTSPDREKKSGEDDTRNQSSANIWALEDAFPDTGQLLTPSKTLSAAHDDVLVVLDTNALLLPFKVSKEDISQIENVYKTLVEQKRLFVPARVIREFIKNRDGRLAEIAKALNDRKSTVTGGTIDIPPLLNGLDETNVMSDAEKKLMEARKGYLNAVSSVVGRIRGWQGDDPVSSIYHKHFSGDVITDIVEAREEIEAQWRVRLKNKVPPGYKDGSKDDTGIGDFIIWSTILKLAKTKHKDLIFVTGEEKADWFIRSDNEGVYLRPELIDEYRRESDGKHLNLSKLANILSDMNAPENLVEEVRKVETEANNAIRMTGGGSFSTHSRSILTVGKSFDYSTNDGVILVEGEGTKISLKFSKASDTSIHLCRCPGTPRIARVKNIESGTQIRFDDFDSSSSSYTLQLGDAFLAQNESRYTLAGRIQRIADDTRGAPKDEVFFNFSIFKPGESPVLP